MPKPIAGLIFKGHSLEWAVSVNPCKYHSFNGNSLSVDERVLADEGTDIDAVDQDSEDKTTEIPEKVPVAHFSSHLNECL